MLPDLPIFGFAVKLAILLVVTFSANLHCLEIINSTNGVHANGFHVYGAQHVMKFLGLTSRQPDDAKITYLKQSIQSELTRRLSPAARIILDRDEDFHLVNERYTDYRRPSFIAGIQVAVENDVVEVVNYARARGLHFMARTGGHSLTTSSRRIQDGLVIDMRGLNTVRYDLAKQQMTVGGGVTTGEFANATFSRGMEVSKYLCIQLKDVFQFKPW
ncbi:MAG: hypothetical protein LQ352_001925 [Teloschistes flavicans]|nr:MAG: hypothetical protein LQ352_001925 [Teloschistes flavicans]